MASCKTSETKSSTTTLCICLYIIQISFKASFQFHLQYIMAIRALLTAIVNVRSGKPSYMNMLMKTTRSGEQHNWSIEPCFRRFALLHRLALVPILGYEAIHDGCRTTCRAISSCEDIHKQSARRTLVDWLHLRNLDLFRIAAVLYGPFWWIARLNRIQCQVHPFHL